MDGLVLRRARARWFASAVLAGALLGCRSGEQQRATSDVVAEDSSARDEGSPQPEPQVPLDFVVTVERTKCLGDCPQAITTVRANGTVQFEGRAHTYFHGEKSFEIPHASVVAIWEAARDIAFFSLDDRYVAKIRDVSSTIITVHANGRRKRVVNHWVGARNPPQLDMHLKLEALADTIERTSMARALLYGY
jgi:hypothetical protein